MNLFTRALVEIVVGTTTGTVVGNVVVATIPLDATRYKRASAMLGGLFIGSYVGEKTSMHVVKQIEDIQRTVRTAKRSIEVVAEEAPKKTTKTTKVNGSKS